MISYPIQKGTLSFPKTSVLTVDFWIKVLKSSSSSVKLFTGRSTNEEATIELSANNTIGVRTGGNCYGGPGRVQYSNFSLTKGETYHVAVVFGSSTIIYVNGELVSSLGATTSCGKVFGSIGNFFDIVTIQLPKFWNRQLPQSEIKEIFKARSAPAEDSIGLIFWSSFDPSRLIVNEVKMSPLVSSGISYYHKSLLIREKTFVHYNGTYKFITKIDDSIFVVDDSGPSMPSTDFIIENGFEIASILDRKAQVVSGNPKSLLNDDNIFRGTLILNKYSNIKNLEIVTK